MASAEICFLPLAFDSASKQVQAASNHFLIETSEQGEIADNLRLACSLTKGADQPKYISEGAFTLQPTFQNVLALQMSQIEWHLRAAVAAIEVLARHIRKSEQN